MDHNGLGQHSPRSRSVTSKRIVIGLGQLQIERSPSPLLITHSKPSCGATPCRLQIELHRGHASHSESLARNGNFRTRQTALVLPGHHDGITSDSKRDDERVSTVAPFAHSDHPLRVLQHSRGRALDIVLERDEQLAPQLGPRLEVVIPGELVADLVDGSDRACVEDGLVQAFP
jgi:hypothetical protein